MQTTTAKESNFPVSHRLGQRNLHIRCTALGEAEAVMVARLASEYQDYCQRIFIDVRDLTDPSAEEACRLRAALRGCVAAEKVVYKGRAGLALAREGERVIVVDERKPGCCGNCANCPRCGQKTPPH